jgi:hypothetical protein
LYPTSRDGLIVGTGQRDADPEVEELHDALRVDHEVRRLHVAVDETERFAVLAGRRVRVLETVADLPPISSTSSSGTAMPCGGRGSPPVAA